MDDNPQPFSDLERYAGWLGKDRASIAVRADVHALGAALDVGTDTSPLLLILTRDIGRLPSGDLRKMLRRSLDQLCTAQRPVSPP